LPSSKRYRRESPTWAQTASPCGVNTRPTKLAWARHLGRDGIHLDDQVGFGDDFAQQLLPDARRTAVARLEFVEHLLGGVQTCSAPLEPAMPSDSTAST
jgi:hypothetical protein